MLLQTLDVPEMSLSFCLVDICYKFVNNLTDLINMLNDFVYGEKLGNFTNISAARSNYQLFYL